MPFRNRVRSAFRKTTPSETAESSSPPPSPSEALQSPPFLGIVPKGRPRFQSHRRRLPLQNLFSSPSKLSSDSHSSELRISNSLYDAQAISKLSPSHALTSELSPLQRNPSLDRDVAPLAPHHQLPAVPQSSQSYINQRVNDGYVSFVVPTGWKAVLITDCFTLSRGLCIGYVRAVHANLASAALLETHLLQSFSEITALSSPVFVSNNQITVQYSSHGGVGTGVAQFDKGFDNAAIVFGVCGPYHQKHYIQEAIEQLCDTSFVQTAPKADFVRSDFGKSQILHPTINTSCTIQ